VLTEPSIFCVPDQTALVSKRLSPYLSSMGPD